MDNLNIYKVIVMVADNGSMSQTATMLHTVPSNVSRMIKKQEDELGFSIFDRSGNKLKLTERGRLFVEHARDILQQEYEFYSNIELLSTRNIIKVGLGLYFTANICKR